MRMEAPERVKYAAERLVLRAALLALAILFVLFAVPQLWSLLSPFLIAIPVAAMLQPLIHFFITKLHMKRGLATGLWVLLVCSAAFFLIFWFVSFGVSQVISAANNAQSIITGIIQGLQTATDRILGAAESLPESISLSIRNWLSKGFQWLGEQGTVYAGKFLNLTVNVAAGVPYALIYANFLVLGIYFISGRYGEMSAFFKRRRNQDEAANMNVLRRSAIKGTLGYLRVQLLWFLLLLVLSWFYFQFLGFQYALLIAIVAACLELIPQFGCGLLYLPWALVCFLIGDAHSGWLVTGFYLAYSLLRRLLDPILLGNNLGISPLFSLIGMFVGMRLGGVIGLILGPIAMLVLVSAVRAHLFDGILEDNHAVVLYLKRRWNRGREKGIMNAEK